MQTRSRSTAWKRITAWIPALCCGAATALYAAGETPTCGVLRVIPRPDDPPNAPLELPLKHTRVEAEIKGFVSRVKVIQVYENPCPTPIEAIYVFPLPQNAAVNDMSIRIGDRLIRGDIKKRDEARKIYENAKRTGKTAALLDQERPNIFSQSVANIMPGHEIQIEITYDEALTYEKGGYEFVFPMVVGPRFIPGSPIGKQGGGWSPDTDQVPDASNITPPVLKPGERNGHDIELTVRLNAGLPIHGLRSPTHEIRIDPAPADDRPIAQPVTVRLAPRDTVPNKDFVLRYDVAGKKPEMALLSQHDGQDGVFLLMFQPPESAAPEEITPKEMVFVMDCSGSMSGEPIALAKQAVRYALNHLNPNDTFQIIRFSESASPFSPQPLPATPENIRRGLSYLNGLNGEGGTMMIEGIKAALDYPHEENRLRIVCFMTDGYIGNETEILAAIGEKLGVQTRLFSLGVGSSVNRYLLERMAEVGRGEVQYILLNEKPDRTVEKFYERVRHPVLTDLRIDWGNLEVTDLTPARIKDLFVGQPIFLLGRYQQPAQGGIRILGNMAGKEVEFPLSVKLNELEVSEPQTLPPAPSALASLWARSRIRELEAEQYGGENADTVKAITELALKYRLMSAYTSFVAVEEKIVNESGRVQTIHVPVEMPEGVSFEGVFEPSAEMPSRLCFQAVAAAPAGMSRNRAQKCGTLLLCDARQEASEVRVDVPSPTASVIPEYEINLQWEEQEERHLLILTTQGELWESVTTPQGGTQRILRRRLEQKERRELWELLEQGLRNVPIELGWDHKGHLNLIVKSQKYTIRLEPGKLHDPTWEQILKLICK